MGGLAWRLTSGRNVTAKPPLRVLPSPGTAPTCLGTAMRAIYASGASGTDCSVLIALVHAGDWDTPSASRSVDLERIADWTGVAPSTVKEAFRRLVAAGVITTTRRGANQSALRRIDWGALELYETPRVGKGGPRFKGQGKAPNQRRRRAGPRASDVREADDAREQQVQPPAPGPRLVDDADVHLDHEGGADAAGADAQRDGQPVDGRPDDTLDASSVVRSSDATGGGLSSDHRTSGGDSVVRSSDVVLADHRTTDVRPSDPFILSSSHDHPPPSPQGGSTTPTAVGLGLTLEQLESSRLELVAQVEEHVRPVSEPACAWLLELVDRLPRVAHLRCPACSSTWTAERGRGPSAPCASCYRAAMQEEDDLSAQLDAVPTGVVVGWVDLAPPGRIGWPTARQRDVARLDAAWAAARRAWSSRG